jgi:spermidine dehydrogenase
MGDRPQTGREQGSRGIWYPAVTDTLYDLVVVGGGISGLSAAHFYRKKFGPDVKILILDNHDDFGGHATRVEFNHNGQTWMGFGGTQFIEGPSLFSTESHTLLRDIGIDLNRFHSTTDRTLFDNMELSRGHFFDREHFGRDVLLRQGSLSWDDYASLLPMSEAAQKDLVRLYTDRSTNYLPGQSSIMKQRTLGQISYLEYLKDHVKVHEEVLTFMQKNTHDTFGIGIDGIPAIRCFRLGKPGFGGLGLKQGQLQQHRGGSLRYKYRSEHLPLSRRMCIRFTAAGKVAHSGCGTWQYHGGCGDGPVQLQPARYRSDQCAAEA